jgi:hypothetical protein
MKLTPKSGNLESSGTPKNSELDCRGQKTLHWGVFISMQRSWSVDIQNGLAWSIWTCAPKLWAKEGPGIKLPTTKSQESTSSWRLQKECDMALESSQGELQLWLRPHSNRRSEPGNISSQSPGSPTWDSFETPPWESREKNAIWMWLLRNSAENTIWGKVVASPKFGSWWVKWVQGRPWLIPTPKGCKMSSNQLVVGFWMQDRVTT